MASDAEVVALGFDIGIHHLIVKKLCGLRAPCYAVGVKVEKAAKEGELPGTVKSRNLYEIGQLEGERIDAVPQAALHASISKRNKAFLLFWLNLVAILLIARTGSEREPSSKATQ